MSWSNMSMLNVIGLHGLTKEHMKSMSVKEMNSALYICYIFCFLLVFLFHYCVFNVSYYVFMMYLFLHFHCVLLCHFIVLTEWKALI